MKNLVFLFLLLQAVNARSQYYYKDIVGSSETNMHMQNLVKAGIHSVSLKSFENDGSLSEGFYVYQIVSNKPNSLKTITRTGTGTETIQTSLTSYFNTDLLLEKTVDSSESLVNNSYYEYDEKGKITRTKSESIDSSGKVVASEEHDWIYAANGRIDKMVRKKNRIPVDEILFVYDNAGNIIEEQTMIKGKITESLYYYYNEDNQMTDIVRYNARAKRLLPDYMFEYSKTGQVLQKITVPGNNSGYLIWRYQYDTRGLKVKEACYDKQKKLLGRIEYTYN